MEQWELIFIDSGKVKWQNHYGKVFGSFSQKYMYTFPMTWQFTSREIKTYVHEKTRVFTAALFTIVLSPPNWKQSNGHK